MIIIFAHVSVPYVRPHFSKYRKTIETLCKNNDHYWWDCGFDTLVINISFINLLFNYYCTPCRSRSPAPRKRQRSISNSPKRKGKASKERRHSRSPPIRRRSRSNDRRRRDRSKSMERRSRERSMSPVIKKKHEHKKDNKRKETKSSDREAKLREMMENAKWREQQRTKNVKHYKKMDEIAEEKAREDHDPSFIRKQLAKAASTGTVEKRIQANKYNIQRGSNSMDSNFARR